MRRKRAVRAASVLQIGIAGILVVLLVLLAAWYGEGLNSCAPGAATFQYVAGQKVDFSEEAAYRNRDGFVSVSDRDAEHTLNSSTPILYAGERKMLLPKNMSLVMPMQSRQAYRVNYFTTVRVAGNVVVLEKDGKSAQVYGGFLYDGEDTYVFLENATLRIGARELELEPLSYVKAVYKQYVEYYNSADGSHEWIGMSETDMTATLKNGCLIDAGKDVIDLGEGEELLYSAVDDLKVLAMNGKVQR